MDIIPFLCDEIKKECTDDVDALCHVLGETAFLMAAARGNIEFETTIYLMQNMISKEAVKCIYSLWLQ